MIMSVSGKVSDMFGLYIQGQVDYDGYVPSDLGIGAGDYIEFDIDMKTGQIQRWKPLTLEMVKSAISDTDDETDETDEYDSGVEDSFVDAIDR